MTDENGLVIFAPAVSDEVGENMIKLLYRCEDGGISTNEFSIFVSTEACSQCPYSLEIISGKDQVGCPGEELPEYLEVSLTDSDGNPASGKTVEILAFNPDGNDVSYNLSTQELVISETGSNTFSFVLGEEEGDCKIRVRYNCSEDPPPAVSILKYRNEDTDYIVKETNATADKEECVPVLKVKNIDFADSLKMVKSQQPSPFWYDEIEYFYDSENSTNNRNNPIAYVKNKKIKVKVKFYIPDSLDKDKMIWIDLDWGEEVEQLLKFKAKRVEIEDLINDENDSISGWVEFTAENNLPNMIYLFPIFINNKREAFEFHFRFSLDNENQNEEGISKWRKGEVTSHSMYIVNDTPLFEQEYKDVIIENNMYKAIPWSIVPFDEIYRMSCSFAFGESNNDEIIDKIFIGCVNLESNNWKYIFPYYTNTSLNSFIDFSSHYRHKGSCGVWCEFFKNLVEIQGIDCYWASIYSKYNTDVINNPEDNIFNLYKTNKIKAIGQQAKYWIFPDHSFILYKDNIIYDPSFMKKIQLLNSVYGYENYLIKWFGVGEEIDDPNNPPTYKSYKIFDSMQIENPEEWKYSYLQINN
ncbi:MAG: hypothetical protein PHV06_00445 [bacterium]|nr:hypothetical protein [bacterium]